MKSDSFIPFISFIYYIVTSKKHEIRFPVCIIHKNIHILKQQKEVKLPYEYKTTFIEKHRKIILKCFHVPEWASTRLEDAGVYLLNAVLNRWQALGKKDILKRFVLVHGARILPDLLTTTAAWSGCLGSCIIAQSLEVIADSKIL